jgi:hypothetical protein
MVTDTWQKVGGSTNNVTLTYDGYGTLITPTNTYTNVVRVKEDYGSGAIDYQWYALNPLISIMVYDHNTNTLYYTGATVTGISEQNYPATTVNIYPNPTSDQFYIEANTTDKLNVDLYDVNGRHVFSKSVNNKSNINVTTLDDGIYTLTIKTVDHVINKKLAILH